MQVHQQNRKIVTNTSGNNMSTQQQASGNPRRTLYSAKQVSQVYRPSQIQYQNHNSSAKKKKQGQQQVLSNAATTLKMMQQTHQTQLFDNGKA